MLTLGYHHLRTQTDIMWDLYWPVARWGFSWKMFCFLYPGGFFLFFPTHSLLLSLSFILFLELRRYTTHRERSTQELQKRTEKRRKQRTDTLTGIYRHRGPYFRMLSAGGQRLEETQDEFSSASFHHTAMTPLFTSSIYLHTDCLPPWLCCVCACCVGKSACVLA